MSLSVKSQFERAQELQTGIHLVIVSDMNLLKDSYGKPIERNGSNFITVRFTDGENKSIDNHFPIGTEKQRYFDLMINHLGLDNTKQVKKKEVIGKRLWIAIKEVHFLVDGVTLKDKDKKDVKEYFVFKTFKYDGEKARPIVKGDPINFDGIAQDEFVDYKIVQDSFNKEENIAPNQTPAF